MDPCFKSYLSHKFDRPETICDRTRINLASHGVRRLTGNYFEPCTAVFRNYKTNTSKKDKNKCQLAIKEKHNHKRYLHLLQVRHQSVVAGQVEL